MGCNTGRAKISETDDLLGLAAAMHFAGAGAIISTLWMINKLDCMLCFKVFYGELVKGVRAGGSEGNTSATVNLARAMQTATLALRKAVFESLTTGRDSPFMALGCPLK